MLHEDHIEAFYVVRSILSDLVDPGDLVLRVEARGSGVYGTRWWSRPLVRFAHGRSGLVMQVPVDTERDAAFPLRTVHDLANYASLLRGLVAPDTETIAAK